MLRPPSALMVAASLACAVPALAQTSPFLPDARQQLLVDALSGDRAFEHIRELSRYHRTAGSRDFFAAAEYIRQAAVAAGLEDVQLVKQKWPGHQWSCRAGEAWLLDPRAKLADYGEIPLSVADYSRTTHVTAELVDVGEGLAERDYAGKDVKGRIVLASGGVSKVQKEAVWKRGALGVLSDASNRPTPLDAPDQIAWGRLPYESKNEEGVADGKASTFAIMIAPRRGQALRKQLAEAKTPVSVKVDIEAELPEAQEQAYVEGWIHGTDVHDQQIVLTAHIQEEKTSANDDGSGCANLLEIGRALGALVKGGALPRPRRDIRFFWANELSSEPQLFHDHPEEARRMLLDINQDMVGAKQSWGSRVQYAAHLPWSLPHPLDDVMESVLLAVRDGNTSLLVHRGTKVPQPFPREVLSIKGTREAFHARSIPYFANSDHHAFTGARVGVPATSLINWPDEFIHSSGDELDNVDPTQLERNALVVAGVSWYFASLADSDVPALAVYVHAQGQRRIAADVATAVDHLMRGGKDSAWRESRALIQQSYRHEEAELGALRRLARGGRTGEIVSQMLQDQEDAMAADYRVLEKAYGALNPGKNPPNIDLAGEARTMAARVFVPVADLATYDESVARARPVEALHPVMAWEALNFADGRRNAWEVYEAVSSEALSAGGWYYGEVRPAEVMETLDRAAKAGAFTVRAAR